MQTHKSYHASLIESLKDPKEAAAYLGAVFEDGDIELISLALKDVAEAQRSADSRESSNITDWEACYQSLNEAQMPEFPTLVKLLSQLGLQLAVTSKIKQSA